MSESEKKNVVRERVYERADTVDWMYLTIDQRRRYYEQWTEDPEIGGVLREVMPAGSVRVYIKDSIMGEYTRSRRLTIRELLRAMGVQCGEAVQEFVKPQAILCNGSDLYTLTAAKDWKISLVNAFERARNLKIESRNVLFIVQHTSGIFVDRSYRTLVEDAGTRLGIAVKWVD